MTMPLSQLGRRAPSRVSLTVARNGGGDIRCYGTRTHVPSHRSRWGAAVKALPTAASQAKLRVLSAPTNGGSSMVVMERDARLAPVAEFARGRMSQVGVASFLA